MEHAVRAVADGQVRKLLFAAGETVNEGDLLLVSEHTVIFHVGWSHKTYMKKLRPPCCPGPLPHCAPTCSA